MSIDRIVMAFAGTVILATLAAYFFAGIEWALYLTAFVGLNMLQAAFTGFCPLAMILKKVGAKPGVAFS
ncbi:MAG: sulfurtransferase [Rhodospirillaceae bacterium BRH_c57]|jgi:hypothetical protein|nr:MAG: sulfurtransferase [Rhodospirillaceae bacterium BRH_c57]